MHDDIDHDGLYRLAESQAAYFTAAQALPAAQREGRAYIRYATESLRVRRACEMAADI